MSYPVLESYNTNSSNVSVSSITITKPTGLAVGDLLVAYITSLSAVHSQTQPSGWTTQYLSQLINGNNAFWTGCYTKVADSSDVAASNFTFSLSTATTIGGILVRVSNVASGYEVEGQNNSRDSDGNTTASFTTTVTPRMSESLVLMAITKYEDGGTVSAYASTPSKTWTEVVEIAWTNGGNDPILALAWADAGSVSQITAHQATLSANTVNVTGSLLLINSPQNAQGTNATFAVSPLLSTQNGVAGGQGSNSLLAVSPTFPTQSGKVENKTQWTNQTKPANAAINNQNKP